jgi:hypothetical protein
LRTNVLDDRWERVDELFDINFNNEKGTITKKRDPQNLKSMKSMALPDMASGSSVDEDHRVVELAVSIFRPKKHNNPVNGVISKWGFIVHK